MADEADKPNTKDDLTKFCPSCGYDLCGLTESRCPECGNIFQQEELPWLSRSNPKLPTPWVAKIMLLAGAVWIVLWAPFWRMYPFSKGEVLWCSLIIVPAYLLVAAVPRKGIALRVFVISTLVLGGAYWFAPVRRLIGRNTLQEFFCFLPLLLSLITALLYKLAFSKKPKYISAWYIKRFDWLPVWYRTVVLFIIALIIILYCAKILLHERYPLWGHPWAPVVLCVMSITIYVLSQRLPHRDHLVDVFAIAASVIIFFAGVFWLLQVIGTWNTPLVRRADWDWLEGIIYRVEGILRHTRYTIRIIFEKIALSIY